MSKGQRWVREGTKWICGGRMFWAEGIAHGKSWAGPCLACWRSSKEAHVAGAERVRGSGQVVQGLVDCGEDLGF